MRQVAALACAALVLVLAPAPAQGTPTSSTTAIVSLGDSYISGEAGRWQGNSIVSTGDRAGTDRAFVPPATYDPSRIYGATDANGCHRSDTAEIRGAAIDVQAKGNISCSGAVTANIFRASQGGVGDKGEPPQSQSLRYVAQVTNVRLVVLSIVGNDLGFADVIRDCAQAYASRTGPCRDRQQAAFEQKRGAAFANLAKAIREVRAVMTESGYARSDYRFIVQSYPSPLPRASETRFPELGADRGAVGGCPFYDADLNYARDSLVNQIADGIRFVSATEGVEFLDLRNAFQGREVCSTASQQATVGTPPSPSTSEWMRFLTLNLAQGEVQETLHPNAYGQQALARCLTLAFAQPRGANGACRNTPGQGPAGMTYARI